MFTWRERRKNEKSEFRAQFFQADGSLIPGFVKQRIRVPDTLFYEAQAGQNGCRRRRPFGLTNQMVRSLASAAWVGVSQRSLQKASDSETRSRATPALHKSGASPICVEFGLDPCFLSE